MSPPIRLHLLVRTRQHTRARVPALSMFTNVQDSMSASESFLRKLRPCPPRRRLVSEHLISQKSSRALSRLEDYPQAKHSCFVPD